MVKEYVGTYYSGLCKYIVISIPTSIIIMFNSLVVKYNLIFFTKVFNTAAHMYDYIVYNIVLLLYTIFSIICSNNQIFVRYLRGYL